MADKNRNALQQQTQGAMLTHAIFQWKSWLIVLSTLVMSGCVGLSSLLIGQLLLLIPVILVLGFIAEAVLIYSTLKNPEIGQEIAKKQLKKQFKPKTLRTPSLQRKVDKAYEYYNRLKTVTNPEKSTLITDSVSDSADQMEYWLRSIYNLAYRIDDFQDEKKQLRKDKNGILRRIRQLKQKQETTNEALSEQIESTLANLQQQLESIENVQNNMEQATLQLENSIAALGTFHSQAVLTTAKATDNRAARKLRLGIDEEVNKLDDLLKAMEEVHAEASENSYH